METPSIYEQLEKRNWKFYVYAYLDPTKPGKYVYDNIEFEFEPFYVGKGCREINYNTVIDLYFEKLTIKEIKNKYNELYNTKHSIIPFRRVLKELNIPSIIKVGVKNAITKKSQLFFDNYTKEKFYNENPQWKKFIAPILT